MNSSNQFPGMKNLHLILLCLKIILPKCNSAFETGFQVEYNSKEFVSIVLNHYQFTGGVHGNYFALGYNIRMDDGIDSDIERYY